MNREFPQATPIGKISTREVNETILTHLGAVSPSVRVGPQSGFDFGIVDIGAGQVMVVTTDPLFVMPELGWERAAWFAVHIIASDIATSGLPPQFATFDLNLPEDFSENELRLLWTAIHCACVEIGVTIIGGHTGRYENCAFPIIGSATFMSIGGADAYVVPTMSCPGDQVVMTKGAAIETAGLFAVCHSKYIAETFGPDFAREAQNIFGQMSVVADARIAASVGLGDAGVTSMHDATERGIAGALVEIAQASGNGILIDREAILIPRPITRICELFAVDPLTTSSEGTLIMTCKPNRADTVIARLKAAGIDAAVIGAMTELSQGIRWSQNGHEEELKEPESDPFWPAFKAAYDR